MPIQLARGELCIIAARDPAALMVALNAVDSEGDGRSAAEHSLCILSKADSQGREWLIAMLTPIAGGGER